MTDKTDSNLLTTGGIATRLGVNRATVDYWVRTGKLVAVDVLPGTRLFSPKDVDELNAARASWKKLGAEDE